MTARDETLEALATYNRDDLSIREVWHHYNDMLDAIPADVLARLAIERGGLKLVDPYTYLDTDDLLYRLVTDES